jgi:hypothetical protein
MSCSSFSLSSGLAQLMEGTLRSWSEVPLELAGLVLGRLSSHIDESALALYALSGALPYSRSGCLHHCSCLHSRMAVHSTACPGASQSTLLAAKMALPQLLVAGWCTVACTACSWWTPSLLWCHYDPSCTASDMCP